VDIYYIIFGAAVQSDGEPSPALRRRIEGALSAANGRRNARFMPTGGAGTSGFVEAEVMRRVLLESGVPIDHIVVESQGRNTLESSRLCTALLAAAGNVECVVPCTNPYHLTRCAVLLRLQGWHVRLAQMPSDLRKVRWWKLLFYYLREGAALPCDVVLLLVRRNMPKDPRAI
jgi:vancomycin permeability regulator SanA